MACRARRRRRDLGAGSCRAAVREGDYFAHSGSRKTRPGGGGEEAPQVGSCKLAARGGQGGKTSRSGRGEERRIGTMLRNRWEWSSFSGAWRAGMAPRVGEVSRISVAAMLERSRGLRMAATGRGCGAGRWRGRLSCIRLDDRRDRHAKENIDAETLRTSLGPRRGHRKWSMREGAARGGEARQAGSISARTGWSHAGMEAGHVGADGRRDGGGYGELPEWAIEAEPAG